MNMKSSLAEKTNNAAKRATFVGNIYEKGVQITKREFLESDIKAFIELHNEGVIHIHDLEGYGNTYNCLTLDILRSFPVKDYANRAPFQKILHIIEYYKLTIANLANEQTGGIAFANFDQEISDLFELLSIEASQENLDYLYSALEMFFYWLNNAMTRYGQECYYVSLNLGLSSTVVGREVTKSLLHIYENSPGTVSVIRPNIIFKVEERINQLPESPNYDLLRLALQCTSKKMNPTYLLCSSRVNDHYPAKELAIVGCRTKVVENKFGKSTAIGRGNIANISINLPRLAFEVKMEDAGNPVQALYNKWEIVATRVKEILLDRLYKTALVSVENYPTNVKYQLWNVPFKENDRGLYDVFKQGTLSIGFIGLAEAFEILYGEKIFNSHQLQEYALDFVKKMRAELDSYGQEEQLNFSLLATSGEGLSYRFPQLDQRLYQSSIFAKGYYTNSFHVEVDSMIHPFKKLEIEGPYHQYCNGGAISYVELGSSPLHNIEALYDMLIKAIDTGVSYLGYNFPLDICKDCHHSGTFDQCPNCQSNHVLRIRRVSGYLEDLSNFGAGKRLEEKRRDVNPWE